MFVDICSAVLQSMEQYNELIPSLGSYTTMGMILPNGYPKEFQWVGVGVLSQSMFFKMDEYLKKISTLQSM
jgi:hypothetical protein